MACRSFNTEARSARLTAEAAANGEGDVVKFQLPVPNIVQNFKVMGGLTHRLAATLKL